MLLWSILLLIVLVALAIPILAIVLESPVVRRLSERHGGESGRGTADLSTRIDALESDVHDLTQSLEALREETEFVRRLLEDVDNPPKSRTLPPPDK